MLLKQSLDPHTRKLAFKFRCPPHQTVLCVCAPLDPHTLRTPCLCLCPKCFSLFPHVALVLAHPMSKWSHLRSMLPFLSALSAFQPVTLRSVQAADPNTFVESIHLFRSTLFLFLAKSTCHFSVNPSTPLSILGSVTAVSGVFYKRLGLGCMWYQWCGFAEVLFGFMKRITSCVLSHCFCFQGLTLFLFVRVNSIIPLCN